MTDSNNRWMPALRILHFVIVFVIVFHSNRNWKNKLAVHIWEKTTTKKIYLTLSANRVRGPYWGIEVVPVRSKRTDRSKVRKTESQYSPVQLEQTRLASTLLYGTRAKLVLKTKSIQLMRNGPYGEISTKREPIKSLGFPSRLPWQYNKPWHQTTT